MMNFRMTLPVLLLLNLLAGTVVVSQSETGPPRQEAATGEAIVISATQAMGESGMTTDVMSINVADISDGAAIMTEFVPAGQFGLAFGNSGDSFSLLNNPSVQKDLLLVDDQLEQIREINKEFSRKIREQMGEFKDENGNFSFDHGSNLADLIRELKQQQQEQIDSILLPNQQQRLKQVARQMKRKQLGTSRLLTEQLAEELDLSEQQQDRIRTRAKELQEEIDRKLAELRANAKQQLIKELSPSQRKKLEELIGDEFVVKDEDQDSRLRRLMVRPGADANGF
jgi:hypothetical protein